MGGKILLSLVVLLASGGAWAEDAQLMTPLETGLVIEHLDVFSRIPETPEETLAFYTNLAQRGNVHAQMNLAFMLAEGLDARQDLPQAFLWFEKAARQGNAVAQLNLAIMLEKGMGVSRNGELAGEWYEKAAKRGNSYAQYEMGQRLEKAQVPDCIAAARFYEQAARQKHARAQLALGKLYESGCGMRQDMLRARAAYLLAAEGGLADAAYQMGLFYKARGDDMRNISGRDLVAARMWFLVAQDLWGNALESSRARSMAAELAGSMTDMEINASAVQAQVWLKASGLQKD
ncbi:MAG TPA: hypothetical protein DCW68_02470 [Rhodospirillaceae bacterium]|nr:MAG: hypothetical protein A2018_05440 [Alphaproteobacteria bacterium GWF2_58_20]HAU28959.1 hypothetical protein [Rhodospirillaceae bacterium]